MKKGLRLSATVSSVGSARSEPSPDEEGIKTAAAADVDLLTVSEPSPDEEGIKTSQDRSGVTIGVGPNRALMKKGLRPGPRSSFPPAPGPNRALMKKGLRRVHRLRTDLAGRSEPSPDEEGIKTQHVCRPWWSGSVRTEP